MSTMGRSPTDVLCGYAAESRYEDIPKEVIEMTKTFILDSMACSVGGSKLEPGRMVIDFFEAMAGSPEATVLPTGKRLPVMHAAYVNAYLANVLDFDDTYANLAHPGATAIPPALAMAEKTKASGRQFLNAVVVGYETSLRVGLATVATPERYKQVWGLSTWQIVGAVMAASKLLGFDKEQIRNAMGLACVNAPVPYARKLGMELDERPFAWSKNNYGWAAMGGVLGAMMTQRGFIGNQFILDGDRGFWVMIGSDRCDFDKMTEALGEKYLIMNNSIKPYASCRWTHTTIDACLKIMEKHPIKPEAVKSVTVKGIYEVTRSLAEQHPKNIIDAQFSIPHVVSLCITGNSPAQGLSEAHLKDDRIQSLARKVKMEIDPTADRLYFEKGGLMLSTVVIETNENGRFEESMSYPKGSPENPMTPGELERKCLSLTSPVLGKSRAEKLLKTIRNLENVKDVSLALPLSP